MTNASIYIVNWNTVNDVKSVNTNWLRIKLKEHHRILSNIIKISKKRLKNGASATQVVIALFKSAVLSF